MHESLSIGFMVVQCGIVNDERVDELDEMLIPIQAEISALKRLMFEANPQLAAQHQALTDRLREQFLEARRRNLQSRFLDRAE